MREEPASRPRPPRGPEADILIKFRGGTDEATRAAVCREAGLELIRAVAGPDLFLARVLAGQTRGQALKQLGARPEVVYAEPNIKRSLRGN
jgi:hypothetical protein